MKKALLIIPIILISCYQLYTNLQSQEKDYIKEDCYIFQKMVTLSTKIYNMQNKADLKIETPLDLQKLIESTTLSNIPKHEGYQPGETYKSDKCGNTWCTIHGNYQKTCIPCEGSDCNEFL